ncbi:MAG: YncE family protein [Myxococcota bacterium]
MSAVRSLLLAVVAAFAVACQPGTSVTGHQNFTSPQSNPILVSRDGAHVYVANTTSNTVSVIDAASRQVVDEIPVGLEPVSLEQTPDGDQLWVSNHVSDSVSVIDTLAGSPTRHTVTHTIQDLDANGVTWFDEPVGIAFSTEKAYVALSSRNDVAVVDLHSKELLGRIHIDAQEPRAITARDGYVYVVAFESHNQTQISGCTDYDPPQCTITAKEIGDFITMPNIPGVEKNIVVDPGIPDRDLFVIDASTDTVVDVVSGVGTLLYGVAVGSDGTVYVSQTDARNAVNGLEVDDLPVLENRMFDNEIGVVDCGGGSCGAPSVIALEPPLPSQPAPGEALATPYGIRISGDDRTLFVTAMGTSRLFSVDTASRTVLDRLDLGTDGQEIPRGVALRESEDGDTAWVLNTLDNSVSVVDVGDPSNLVWLDEIPVGDDPTPDEVRRGRIAFMNAFASDSGTFSCESCHPDGNTDHLLWAIGGACFFGACSGHDEPRTTMPVRGLTGTLPLHWDGTLGDPIGGVNGAVGPTGSEPPNCTDDHSCFRQLVDASLSGVMCDQVPSCATGPSGLPGRLGEQEREDMAFFLDSVAYPPARSRAMDDVLSASAVDGFEDFFVDNGGIGSLIPGAGGISTCGDMNNGCHALPLLVSTNTNTLQGFDAPTMRGLTDRFVQFSLALSSNLIAMEEAATGLVPIPFNGFPLPVPPSPLPFDPAEGFEEDVIFAAAFAAFDGIYNVGPLDIFQMIEEMSTGTSGAVGRQVTLSQQSTDAAHLAQTQALVAALEAADERGVVNLQAVGHDLQSDHPIEFVYRQVAGGGLAWVGLGGDVFSSAQLVSLAQAGEILVTLTAQLPEGYGSQPQPLLLPSTDGFGVIGSPDLPRMPQENPFDLRGRHVTQAARLFLNGQPTTGSIACVGGAFTPYCDSELIEVTLDSPPVAPNGVHTLQVQNPKGPLSNEMPLCRADTTAECL